LDEVDAANELYHLGRNKVNGMFTSHQTAKEGVSLLEQAAALGHLEAQVQLHHIYQRGLGIETNSVKARSWLQSAAAHENREAQFILGCQYLNGGDGIVRNETEGIRILEHSAAQGYAKAHLGLARVKKASLDQGDTQYTIEEVKSHLKQALESDHRLTEAKQIFAKIEREEQLRGIPPEEQISCCCFALCFDCCYAKEGRIGLLKHEFNTCFFCCCAGPIYGLRTNALRCVLGGCVGLLCGPVWCVSGCCTKQEKRKILNDFILRADPGPSLEDVWNQCWK
jgi:hypothetical protein